MTTRFDSYSEYANATSSEKLTLAHVSAFQRLYNFTLDSGNLYKRVTNHVVTGVKRADAQLTAVTASNLVDDETKFYFDINTSTLYLYSLSGDLASDKVIVNYRLFFSTGPLQLAWDLTDTGLPVEYEPLIDAAPNFKSSVGTAQKGISLTGNGNLVLQNNDGRFDNLYDNLTFEQKNVEIYSFHRDLRPSQAQIIYRGIISDKSYTAQSVSFKITDNFFKLDQRVPLSQYDESDSVSEAFFGNFKRRIYGKLDGLLIRSIDQVGQGFSLTGTVTNLTIGNTTLSGTGTAFLDEVSPGDVLTIEGEEFQIDSIESDTSLTIGDSDGFSIVFQDSTASNLPERPWRKKNREFIVADHAIREVVTDLVDHPQLNRLEVTDASKFEAGDIIDVGGFSGEIKRVSGNRITTTLNLGGLVSVPANVAKRSISKVYIEGQEIVLDDISSIDNTSAGCNLNLTNTAEFNIALNRSMPSFATFTFTNGSREITTTDDIDLTQFIQPRDWVKAGSAPDLEFYEVLRVETQKVTLRVPFSEATTSERMAFRTPILIGDNTNVSCDVFGKTKDGEPSGEWIRTASEIIYDLLEESDLSDFIYQPGFDLADENASQIISLALPQSITSRAQPSIRQVVDILNQTVFGSLVLTNQLEMTYNILDVGLPSPDLRQIDEDDNINWNIKSSSAKLFKSANTQYRFLDFDNASLEKGSKNLSFTSEYVQDFETSSNTEDLELFVYNENDAQELTERFVYFNSLSEAEIQLTGSLNLSDIEMGQKVLLNLDRLYTRLGDSNNNQKVGTVIGVERSGDTVKLKISDLGNLYNRSAIISADDEVDFDWATSDEKIVTAYITDENGIVDSDEDTVNTNLIT